jgi:hypothetical protein
MMKMMKQVLQRAEGPLATVLNPVLSVRYPYGGLGYIYSHPHPDSAHSKAAFILFSQQCCITSATARSTTRNAIFAIASDCSISHTGVVTLGSRSQATPRLRIYPGTQSHWVLGRSVQPDVRWHQHVSIHCWIWRPSTALDGVQERTKGGMSSESAGQKS